MADIFAELCKYKAMLQTYNFTGFILKRKSNLLVKKCGFANAILDLIQSAHLALFVTLLPKYFKNSNC